MPLVRSFSLALHQFVIGTALAVQRLVRQDRRSIPAGLSLANRSPSVEESAVAANGTPQVRSIRLRESDCPDDPDSARQARDLPRP